MSLPSTFLKCYCTVTDQVMNAKYRIPRSVKMIRNIPYGPHGKWNQLDVLLPKTYTGKLPVIINIHGGAWVYGTKDVYKYYCAWLAAKGFAVVSFNYRLAPEHQMPAPMEDLNNVVKWTLAHQDDYDFDLNHLFLVGDSAGAHMAAFYSCMLKNPDCLPELNLDLPKDLKIKALLLNCGAYYMPDVPKIKPHFAGLVYDILGKDAPPEVLEKYSPSVYITEDFPPCYVMTSREDFLRSQNPFLVKELRRLNIPHVFKTYAKSKGKLVHIFHLDIGQRAARRCNEDEIRFLYTFL